MTQELDTFSASTIDAVVSADLTRTITSWNPAAERLFGYSADEACGQCVDLVVPPDRRSEWMAAFERIRAGESVLLETTRRHKSGERVDCTITLSPLRSPSGSIVGVWGVARDARAAHATALALLERDSQFSAIVEQSIAGVWIVGGDGIVRYVNQGFVSVGGFAAEEIIGRPFFDFVIADDRPQAVQAFGAIMETGRSLSGELRLVTRHGEYREVLAHSSRAEQGGECVMVGLAIDVTERKAAFQAIQFSNRVLRTINEATQVVAHARTEEELASAMCHLLVTTGGYAVATLSLDTATGAYQAAWGACGDVVQPAPAGWVERAVVARAAGVVETGRLHTEVSADGAPISVCRALGHELQLRSSIFLPIGSGEKPFGAVGVFLEDARQATAEELALLTDLASHLGYGIAHMRATARHQATTLRLQRGLEQTVSALAAAVDARDPYTAGHQQRVARLACAIAAEVGLDEERTAGLRLAALIHDVGKIAVPAELLVKSGPISAIERQLIETHVEAGYQILKNVEFPWPVAEFVRQHHERLDGSGYPLALRGREVALESQILGVADFVEAYSAHRPYRPARGIASALEALAADRDTLFAGDLVDACHRVFARGDFSF